MRRLGAHPGRVLAAIVVAGVFAATLGLAAVAQAATVTIPQMPANPQMSPGVLKLFEQLSNSPVYEQECYFCHGQLGTSATFASEIKFSHAEHIKIECASCHPKFPHSSAGTVKPTMQMCFNCHGVRHGGMGLLANDKCEACHYTPRTDMPVFHTGTADWKGKGHVAPALVPAAVGLHVTGTQTRCMMCHKQEECVACHVQKGILWQPKGGWGYISQDGCNACHSQSTLLKAGPDGTAQSFLVTGLDTSVHGNIACQQCHIDFTYRDTTPPSKLWQVNAGMGCMYCHQTNQPRATFKNSIHYVKLQQFLKGDQSVAQQATTRPTLPPTCASCHGSHMIMKQDTVFSKQMFHSPLNAALTCGQAGCHTGQYASYNDYYHGAAYKKGAPDAPACWQCHGSHDVWPASNNVLSSVSTRNLPKTCGGAEAGQGFACHKNSKEEFTANAGQLIHNKVVVAKENPIRAFFTNLRSKF